MSWLFVFIAGMFEIVWVVAMKYSEGFSKLLPSSITIAALIMSMIFLSLALKNIPIGNAYAVWTGIGVAGVAIFGMVWLGEPANLLRVFFLLCIVAGIIGLKLLDVSK